MDDVPDRALLVAVRPRLGESVVQIGPDRSRRSGGGERVTSRALALAEEELLAVLLVGRSFRDSARATAGQRNRQGHPAGGGEQRPHSMREAGGPP